MQHLQAAVLVFLVVGPLAASPIQPVCSSTGSATSGSNCVTASLFSSSNDSLNWNTAQNTHPMPAGHQLAWAPSSTAGLQVAVYTASTAPPVPAAPAQEGAQGGQATIDHNQWVYGDTGTVSARLPIGDYLLDAASNQLALSFSSANANFTGLNAIGFYVSANGGDANTPFLYDVTITAYGTDLNQALASYTASGAAGGTCAAYTSNGVQCDSSGAVTYVSYWDPSNPAADAYGYYNGPTLETSRSAYVGIAIQGGVNNIKTLLISVTANGGGSVPAVWLDALSMDWAQAEQTVPEPSTLLLLGASLAGLTLLRRRRS